MKRLAILCTALAAAALAWATCSFSADITTTSLLLNGVASGASANAGNPIGVTFTAASTGADSSASGSSYGVTSTIYVVDPLGNTESTAGATTTVGCGAGSKTLYLTVTAASGGNYTIRVNSVGAADPAPANGWISQVIAVTPPSTPVPTVTPASAAGSLPAELAGEKLVLAPNPAAKGSTIKPYLDKPARSVKITVCNIQGDKVAEAENAWLANVAPGIYLMKVEAFWQNGGSQVWTKKVAVK